MEDAALLGGISGGDKLLRRLALKYIARSAHPTACFGLVSEYLQSAVPDGPCIWMLRLGSQLFGGCWPLEGTHNLDLKVFSFKLAIGFKKGPGARELWLAALAFF